LPCDSQPSSRVGLIPKFPIHLRSKIGSTHQSLTYSSSEIKLELFELKLARAARELGIVTIVFSEHDKRNKILAIWQAVKQLQGIISQGIRRNVILGGFCQNFDPGYIWNTSIACLVTYQRRTSDPHFWNPWLKLAMA